MTEPAFGPGHPDWRPPRGYRWEPFAAGNLASLRHGVYSPRTWKPLADRIAAELPDVAPWCARSTYGPAVTAWARVEAQLQLVMAWLDEHGPLDGQGEPRPATNLLVRLESQAQSLRAELGLSPLALAKLLSAFTSAPVDTDDALEQLRAEARKIVEARTAALATDESRDAGTSTP